MGNSQQSISAPDSRLRRVVIVLSSLPSSLASQLLQDIDPSIQARIERALETLPDIDVSARTDVLHDFRQQMFAAPTHEASLAARDVSTEEYQDEFDVGRANHRSSSNSTDPLDPQVASVVSQWELPRSFQSDSPNESPFAFLDDVDDDTVVKLLSEEHVQTIALVFASITPKQAARILPRLDSDLQSETVRRIGRLEDIPEATAAEVAAHLRERADELEQSANNPGHRTLKAIIDAMPDGLETQTPEKHDSFDVEQTVDENDVEDSQQATEDTIRIEVEGPADKGMSADDVHVHLIQLPPQELCRALGQVATREALLALCGLPNDVAEKALSILPRRKAKEVRRGMANLTSVRLRDIDAAKKSAALASLEFAPRLSSASAPIAA